MRKAFPLPLLLLALGGIFSCSGTTGSSSLKAIDIGDNSPSVILASGDSVTYGIDSSGNAGYRRELERLMTGQGRPVTVVNGGRPGVRSHNIDLVIGDMNRYRPAVVVLQYGVNDALNGGEGTPAAVVGNLRHMINAVQHNRSIAVLTTLTPTCGYREGQNETIGRINEGLREMYAEFEENERVVLADVAEAFVLSDPAGGGCAFISPAHQNHPNAEGYGLMAQIIAETLRPLVW